MSEKRVYSSKVEAAYEANHPKNTPFAKGSILLTPILAIAAIFCAYHGINEDEFFIIVAIIFGVCFLFFGFLSVIFLSAFSTYKKDTEKTKRKFSAQIDGFFYDKCVEAGCTDITKRSDAEKIYSIAKAEGYTESKEEILEIFRYIPTLLAELENEQRIADEKTRLSEIAEAEKKAEEENKQYINFRGTEKPCAFIDTKIAALRQQKAEINSNIRTVNNGASAYYSLNKQHEPNWATHGGIASALGGTAAGISVAADVAQRSAAAKAHNQQISQNASTIRTTFNANNYFHIADIDKEIQNLQKSKQDLQTLLVEEIPEDKLLKYISPEVLSQETTETGAIKLSIKTQSSPKFFILDDVPAVVDGSIKVLLMSGNEVAGTAYFSLPFSGSASIAYTNVICCDVKGNVTDVVFKPYNLWAIESKNRTEEKKPKAKTEKKVSPPTTFKATEIYKPETREECKKAIIRSMVPGKKYTITEIIENCPEISDLTNPAVSNIVRQLIPSHIERVEENRKAYFRLK